MTHVGILENQVMGSKINVIMVCCKAEFEKKPEYLEDLPEKMKSYSKFLGKQPSWFARDETTFMDFLNYGSLHQQHTVELKCLDMFPSPKDLLPRTEVR
ncbi:Glutathione S-transferase Mu 2 [Lemmus lemmus]